MLLPVTDDLNAAKHQERPESDFLLLNKTVEQSQTRNNVSQAFSDEELSFLLKVGLLQSKTFTSIWHLVDHFLNCYNFTLVGIVLNQTIKFA